jgi:hypothetical protein
LILNSLSLHIDSVPFLKVFVTSRPEVDVRHAFRDDSLRQRSNILALHLVDQTSVDKDVGLFLKDKLTKIAKGRSFEDLSKDWPPKELLKLLVRKTSGLFIFASTLCKYIESSGDLDERLQEIAWLPTSDHEGRFGIDALYQKIMESAIAPVVDEETQQGLHHCRRILGTIILLQNPLSLKDLSQVLGLKLARVAALLRGFHSVLAMPQSDDKSGVLRIIHSSFRDFLTTESRCKGTGLLVQPAIQHGEIAKCLFKRMSQDLKRNICNLDRFKFNREVKDLEARRDKSIDGSLAYACRYWADHVVCASGDGNEASSLVAALDDFVQNRLLYWIETLSLLGNMSIAVDALQKTKAWHLV